MTGFTIVLDKVQKLGNFMEIELLNVNSKKAQKAIFNLYKKFGIDKKDIYSGGENYFDMILNKR